MQKFVHFERVLCLTYWVQEVISRNNWLSKYLKLALGFKTVADPKYEWLGLLQYALHTIFFLRNW